MIVLPISSSITLSGATAVYASVPMTCRIVGASYLVTTAITVATGTITISDGTTDAGSISCAVASANTSAGNYTLDTTSLGKVKFDKDTPIKLTPDGASTAGVVLVTLLLDEYHAD